MTEKEIWEAYKSSQIFFSLCEKSEAYFNTELPKDEAILLFTNAIMQEETYKESIKNLRPLLSKAGLLRYREQFKQFKYRECNRLKSITVKDETYQKLIAISGQFGGINDMLFEYALDNEYYIDNSKIKDMPSGLNDNQKLTVLLSLLDESSKLLIEKGLKTAFDEGFKEGQNTKKIRSKKGLSEALNELVYKRALD